jgi:hypothetical protein
MVSPTKEGQAVVKARQTLGQVLVAVGGVLALGGVASFVLPRVELRAPAGLVTSVGGRLAWIGLTLGLALVGLWLLRRAREGQG